MAASILGMIPKSDAALDKRSRVANHVHFWTNSSQLERPDTGHSPSIINFID
jgi:hypothetical protein